MLARALLLVVPLCLSAAAGEPAWSPLGDGAWTADASGRTLHQGRATGPALAVTRPDGGSGRAWRCLVEPGPYLGQAGLRLGCGADGQAGLDLVLGADHGQGLALRQVGSGQVLWQDRFLAVELYGPLWLEAVVEADRVRVQALAPDGQELLAQSGWLALSPAPTAVTDPHLGLRTDQATARFWGWTRADTPLAEITPNNPSVLRLRQEGDTSWVTVGGGSWQWEDVTRTVLRQRRVTERTTAFQTTPLPAVGTWRCRLTLDKGTCGGGMLVHANQEMTEGFNLWLGGTFGDGGLMLYRYPLQCLWSSPQGQWHWDTEYVLEGSVADGRIRTRLLAADGTTLIAESPEFPLTPAETARQGLRGFQTWHGTGRFWPAEAATAAPAPAPAAAAAAAAVKAMAGQGGTTVVGGWTIRAGAWVWGQGGGRVRQTAATPALAWTRAVQGARGRFRCTVTPHGAQSVALLFQVSADGQQGFECRLGKGVQLRALPDTLQWEAPAPELAADTTYTLEGIVRTDRVQVRVLAADGRVLAESVERYVSDTNNARVGGLGFRTTGGAAEFADWAWSGEPAP